MEAARKTPAYMTKTRTKRNFNLQTSDISGAQPRSHFKKLEEKINRAKHIAQKPKHTCGGYNPYEPSLINLKRDYDDSESHMLEVDYKQAKAKRGITGAHKLQSGKFIWVKGNKKYLDTTNKDQFISDRRIEKNQVLFLNDLSGKDDRANDPSQRRDKYIRRKGPNRRDCSEDYKYVAKVERREFTNKKDLRFDVLDINQKKIDFVPDELENDPDYLAYRERLDRAAREGYLANICNNRIANFAEFEAGRRIWRSKSASRVGQLRGLRSKRSTSPMRQASQNRLRRQSYLSKDEVDVKPYNPTRREKG